MKTLRIVLLSALMLHGIGFNSPVMASSVASNVASRVALFAAGVVVGGVAGVKIYQKAHCVWKKRKEPIAMMKGFISGFVAGASVTALGFTLYPLIKSR